MTAAVLAGFRTSLLHRQPVCLCWANRHVRFAHELNDRAPLPVTAPGSRAMRDTAEEQHIPRPQRRFVDLGQINAGGLRPRDGE